MLFGNATPAAIIQTKPGKGRQRNQEAQFRKNPAEPTQRADSSQDETENYNPFWQEFHERRWNAHASHENRDRYGKPTPPSANCR